MGSPRPPAAIVAHSITYTHILYTRPFGGRRSVYCDSTASGEQRQHTRDLLKYARGRGTHPIHGGRGIARIVRLKAASCVELLGVQFMLTCRKHPGSSTTMCVRHRNLGQPLHSIEDYLRSEVMPTYANTHSSGSSCGIQVRNDTPTNTRTSTCGYISRDGDREDSNRADHCSVKHRHPDNAPQHSRSLLLSSLARRFLGTCD